MARDYRTAPRESFQCVLCGSASDRQRTILRDDLFSMGLPTVICEVCALVFTNPRFGNETYVRFYAGDYRLLYNRPGVPDRNPAKWIGDAAAADFRVAYYRRFLRPEMRLVEVGCGTGAFLKALHRTVPEAQLTGIESNQPLAQFAEEMSGVPVAITDAESGPHAIEGCDTVAMFHVLEHMPDPHRTLNAVKARLAAGGRILVEVPDVLGPWRGIGMFHVAHTHAFSRNTLQRLVSAVGFEVEHCEAASYPGLEAALFLVARMPARPRDPGRKIEADPSEIQANIDWIRRRARGAMAARLGKSALLRIRAVREKVIRTVRVRGFAEVP